MAACTYCNQSISFFELVQSPFVKRCRDCNARLATMMRQWSDTIEQAFVAGGVTKDLEGALYQNFQQMRVPQDVGSLVVSRLGYLRGLSEIQWGNIPIIRVDIHLDSDEYAHFTLPVTYQKPNKQIKYVPGRLIGTNKTMYFVSSTGKDNAKLDWNNVIQVTIQPYNASTHTRSIHLQVARGSGGGAYSVADPQYAKVIIDTLVRLWKRQLVLYKEQGAHGSIPEHVKAAVFQRDGGRCVQCYYSGPYIEYDHRQPRSKGGQNTVENIQLLCRGCNLKKGNRV